MGDLSVGDTVLVVPLMASLRDGVVTRTSHGIVIVRDVFGTVHKCHGADGDGLLIGGNQCRVYRSREHYDHCIEVARLRAVVGRAALGCRDVSQLEAAAKALKAEP